MSGVSRAIMKTIQRIGSLGRENLRRCVCFKFSAFVPAMCSFFAPNSEPPSEGMGIASCLRDCLPFLFQGQVKRPALFSYLTRMLEFSPGPHKSIPSCSRAMQSTESWGHSWVLQRLGNSCIALGEPPGTWQKNVKADSKLPNAAFMQEEYLGHQDYF